MITVKQWLKYCFYLSLVALAACGFDNDNDDEVLTGTFVDAPVSNMAFSTATQSGRTDSAGNYRFRAGERVTFSFGSITLPPVTAKEVVTPVDIALETDNSADINSDVTVNIARLLQSVDADGDPDNGIDIPDDVTPTGSIDFTVDSATFEAEFAAEFPALPLVSEADAKEHLQEQIDALDDGAGDGGDTTAFSISGSIDNPDTVTGQWELFIDDVFNNDGSLDTISSITFSSGDIADGASYEVRPSSTDCSVTNGTGTVSGAVITDVTIVCSAPVVAPTAFSISGSIDNPDNIGFQWELFIDDVFNNDGSLDTISNITFSLGDIADGAAYEVRPSSTDCSVTNGTGTVSGADITDVAIVCASPVEPVNPAAFSISGSIDNPDSISGQWELFVNGSFANDGGLATISSITFSAADIAAGSDYEVRPSATDCSVTNGTGVVTDANIINVAIVCATPDEPEDPPATVNTDLVGNVTLIFTETIAGSPYTDQQEVAFTIGSDNTLSFDGTSLSDPFFRGSNTAEIIWLDSSNNVEYALSDNQAGTFNEINVSVAGTFSGQFKSPEPLAVSILAPFANDYVTEVFDVNGPRSGGTLRDFFLPGIDIGSSLAISISSEGVLTVGDNLLVFDPSDSSFASFDNLSQASSNIRLSFTDAEGETFRAVIFVEGETAVRFSLSQDSNFNRADADVRPLATEITGMFSRLRSLGEQELTLVTDSAALQSIANGALGTFRGETSQCQRLSFEATDPDTSDNRDDLRIMLGGSIASRLDFKQGESRYFLDENGDEVLTFIGAQLTIKPDDSLELGFGVVSPVSKRLDISQDLASNNTATVDEQCGDFHAVGGIVTGDPGTGITLGLVDTATGKQLLNYGNLQVTETTASFTGQVQRDTNYEVRVLSLVNQFTSVFCPIDNATGTVGDADITDVVVTCGDTPPEGTFQISGTFPEGVFVTMTLNESIFSTISIRNASGQITGGDYVPIRGLADGTTFSISASNCLSEPITGTIAGADQVVNIVCDL